MLHKLKRRYLLSQLSILPAKCRNLHLLGSTVPGSRVFEKPPTARIARVGAHLDTKTGVKNRQG